LQFEAMLAASRTSQNVNDFALVALLGLLGLRIFEATGASVEDLGEAHGYRVMRVHGKGDEIALVPLPPAVGRAVDRAIEGRDHGPLLRNRTGRRMDRHGAFVTTMLDAGVDLREVPTTSSPPSWPQPPSP
jgi:site-specific recombinase XerD